MNPRKKKSGRSKLKPILAALAVMSALLLIQSGLSGLRRAALELSSLSFALRFGVKEVRAQEFISRLIEGSPMLIVDVRQKNERDISVIPGAVALRPGDDLQSDPVCAAFIKKYENAAAENRPPIVIYSTVGYRSARFINESNLDISLPVKNLHGGIAAYVNGGGWIVDTKDGNSVNRIHGYNRFWAWMVDPSIETVTRPQ